MNEYCEHTVGCLKTAIANESDDYIEFEDEYILNLLSARLSLSLDAHCLVNISFVSRKAY